MDSNKLIIALDGLDVGEALGFADLLRSKVWGFKVNDLLFADHGIIRKLKEFGHVFADAKLHDIPNTVKNSTAKISVEGADMITVHALGGVEMMRSAKEVAGGSKVLAVTVLTSSADSKEVIRLTREALKAGVDGVVCSGRDLEEINKVPGAENLLKVVPGVRPTWYKAKDDQKRTITPEEAFRNDADYLVIGRPILNADDPIEAIKNLIQL